jgi:hypothetical protein
VKPNTDWAKTLSNADTSRMMACIGGSLLNMTLHTSLSDPVGEQGT